MVVCEELVTGFVVVIVRIGLLVFGFFVFFICFVKEMEKSKNKCEVEQPHSSVAQRMKAG